MDLSSNIHSSGASKRRIPSSSPFLMLLLVAVLQIPATFAYTCTLNHKRLLCRHGTKSASGVFDARRINILYMQEIEEEEESAAASNVIDSSHAESTTTVQKNHHHHHHVQSNKRAKMHRLIQRMKSVAPKLKICLPSFMARLKSIETELLEEDIMIETNGDTNESLLKEQEDEILVDEPPSLDRSATAASHVDLSGTWRPIVTPAFKVKYDEYLQNCSQSFFYRKVIVNGIALQKEIILQDGPNLQIVASNPAGNWNRTLVASGSHTNPILVNLQDPDGDTVQVESWWEENGTVHRSWLRNKPRLLGGAFETLRYLSPDDPNVLLCDSIFHPSPSSTASKGFQYGRVLWKFRRET